MPIEITMPRLSDTMEQGTVVSWNVKEGDEVSAGDAIADIETDKATMELQVYDDGTLAKIVVGEGKTVGVGELIAVLAEEGEDVQEAAKAAEGGASKKKERAEDEGESKAEADEGEAAEKDKDEKDKGEKKSREKQEGGEEKRRERPAATATADGAAETTSNGHASAPSAPGSGPGGRIFASPLARKMADEAGIDLGNVHGSGPSGRIVKRDVQDAIESGAPAAPPAEAAPSVPSVPAPAMKLEARTVELSNMRRTIAKRLVESKTTIPHYQVTMTVNLDPLLELRRQLNEQLATQNVKLSVNDFLVRASALAIHSHPFVNSKWADEKIEILEDVNVGVAIAIPVEKGGGLVVATLRHADRMGLRHISTETKRLAEKARAKGLSLEEMSDSTFTLSNLGMFGVDHFTAIINPPNAAILAVGGSVQKPVVRDGQVVIGNEMSMTMSSDHRIIDGAMAAQYLQTLKGLLEAPATLLV